MTGKTPETHRNGPRSDEQGEVDPNCVSEIRGPQNGAHGSGFCIHDFPTGLCGDCNGTPALRIEPTPRTYQEPVTGVRIWPLPPTKPTARRTPPPEEEPTDDPAVNVARDLRAILHMAAMLGERSLDLADHPDILGGDAMVNLAHVANLEAWTNQTDTTERLSLDPRTKSRAYTSAADEDPDEAWPPFQMLEFWTEQWRRDLGKDHDGQPTLTSEARFLLGRGMLEWAQASEMHFEEFAADVKAARAKLENIVRDGIRETRSRITCDRCANPKRLIRKYGKAGKPDTWKAPCCKAVFTDDEATRAHAKQLRSQGAEKWVERTEAIGALQVQGWGRNVVRQWLADEVETACEVGTRRVMVWWPTLWRRHLVEAQEKAERERRRLELAMCRDVCQSHHGPHCWTRGRCTHSTLLAGTTGV